MWSPVFDICGAHADVAADTYVTTSHTACRTGTPLALTLSREIPITSVTCGVVAAWLLWCQGGGIDDAVGGE